MIEQRTAAILAAIVSLFLTVPALAQVSKDGMGKVLPVELFPCNYRDGQGEAELNEVIDRWSSYADDKGIDNYAAWTLMPYHFGPDQDFDVIWMGAFSDGNAMGSTIGEWLTSGGELQAAFARVLDCDAHLLLSSAMYMAPADNRTPASAIISMMDCELNKGHRYSDIKAAELRWVEYLRGAGSRAGYWHWFPTFGGGDAEYDYKVVTAYRDYAELGESFERYANGGGRETSEGIFADIDDCDDARVYVATSRRSAQLR